MKKLSVSAQWLLLFLLFLNWGSHASFAFSFSELEEELSPTEETLKPSHAEIWAIRENLVPEYSDPSENNFSGSVTGQDHFLIPIPVIKGGKSLSVYKRDLRKYISDLIFPTHFFL